MSTPNGTDWDRWRGHVEEQLDNLPERLDEQTAQIQDRVTQSHQSLAARLDAQDKAIAELQRTVDDRRVTFRWRVGTMIAGVASMVAFVALAIEIVRWAS